MDFMPKIVTRDKDRHFMIKGSTHEEYITIINKGFPSSSFGKESTCNAGDPCSILGLGRSAGEWIGYPLQYFGPENFMGLQRVGQD